MPLSLDFLAFFSFFQSCETTVRPQEIAENTLTFAVEVHANVPKDTELTRKTKLVLAVRQ
jgi:hypothetical protein